MPPQHLRERGQYVGPMSSRESGWHGNGIVVRWLWYTTHDVGSRVAGAVVVVVCVLLIFPSSPPHVESFYFRAFPNKACDMNRQTHTGNHKRYGKQERCHYRRCVRALLVVCVANAEWHVDHISTVNRHRVSFISWKRYE